MVFLEVRTREGMMGREGVTGSELVINIKGLSVLRLETLLVFLIVKFLLISGALLLFSPYPIINTNG